MIHKEIPKHILILGGTTEANQLAEQLFKDSIYEVTTSRAGVTTDRKKVSGGERLGGFGGIEGLKSYLETNNIDAVIDATHPFATTITDHAYAACQDIGVPHLILQRPAWGKEDTDEWIDVPDIKAAQNYLGSREKNLTVFLTTGQKELDGFTSITKHNFVARMIEPPTTEVKRPNLKIILQRGPFTVHDEIQLIKEEKIDLIVSKNSGGSATSAKIIAARQHNIPVVMISRPPLPQAMVKGTIEDCLDWLDPKVEDKERL
jgi:precorrin-6A/cobalt-precorrin-6A reductase